MNNNIKKVLFSLFKNFIKFLAFLVMTFIILVISLCAFIYFKDKFGFNLDLMRAEKMFQKDEMLKTEIIDNINLDKLPESYYDDDDEKIIDVTKKLEEKNKSSLTRIIKTNNDMAVILVPYWFYYSFEGYTELYEYNLKNKNLKKLGWINGYYEYAKFKSKNNNELIIYDGYIATDLLDGKMDEIEKPILIFLR